MKANWALQSSAKLPRCGIMNGTSGYSVASSSTAVPRPSHHRAPVRKSARDLADLASNASIIRCTLMPTNPNCSTASCTNTRTTRPRSRPHGQRQSHRSDRDGWPRCVRPRDLPWRNPSETQQRAPCARSRPARRGADICRAGARIPRTGESITFARMTVTVDNHG